MTPTSQLLWHRRSVASPAEAAHCERWMLGRTRDLARLSILVAFVIHAAGVILAVTSFTWSKDVVLSISGSTLAFLAAVTLARRRYALSILDVYLVAVVPTFGMVAFLFHHDVALP